MLCCATLCCAVQHYAVLCNTMLCYALLCCAVQHYALLCCAVQHYAVLCFAVFCCVVLCCTAVAKSSDIHFVFAKLAGPWHKMTANIISVSHIISTGESVN